MVGVSELEATLNNFVCSVDTFDFIGCPHQALHQSVKGFIDWCKIEGNISQEGINWLVKIFQSIPFGYCNVAYILEYVRKEYPHNG